MRGPRRRGPGLCRRDPGETLADNILVVAVLATVFSGVGALIASPAPRTRQAGSSAPPQVRVLMRANDPLYEVGLRMGGHGMEDRMWQRTLANLAGHFGVRDPVETNAVCVDPKLQRREYKNVWHNAGIRSAIHTMTAPLRCGRARSQR